MDPVPPLSTDGAKNLAGRKLPWVLLVVLATAPLTWLFVIFFILRVGREQFRLRLPDNVMLLIATTAALVVAAGVAWFGLRSGWHRRRTQLWGWGLASACSIALLVSATRYFQQSHRETQLKAVFGNLQQIDAALGQFSLEFSDRIFFTYDDFIGPNEYIKSITLFVGEDYHVLFPLLRNWTEPLSVTRPDGRVERRSGVLAITLRDGTRVGYPGGLDAKESLQPDGVHVFALFDRSRMEITYRGGVPDGPFRAYHADGSLWGEATYEHGRITGPCWVYLKNGTKFNENTPGRWRPDGLGRE